MGILAVFSADLSLAALPRLPAQGLALETKAGVQLPTRSPLATIRGLDLADDKKTAHGLVMRDRRGRLFSLDVFGRRVRRVYEIPSRIPGCRLTDTQLSVPLSGKPRLLLRTRQPAGYAMWGG